MTDEPKLPCAKCGATLDDVLEPQECEECGQCYCEDCAEEAEWSTDDPVCPSCKDNAVSPGEGEYDKEEDE